MATREQMDFERFQAYEASIQRGIRKQEVTADMAKFAVGIVSGGAIMEQSTTPVSREQTVVTEIPSETRRSYGAPAVGNVVQLRRAPITEQIYPGYAAQAA